MLRYLSIVHQLWHKKKSSLYSTNFISLCDPKLMICLPGHKLTAKTVFLKTSRSSQSPWVAVVVLVVYEKDRRREHPCLKTQPPILSIRIAATNQKHNMLSQPLIPPHYLNLKYQENMLSTDALHSFLSLIWEVRYIPCWQQLHVKQESVWLSKVVHEGGFTESRWKITVSPCT